MGKKKFIKSVSFLNRYGTCRSKEVNSGGSVTGGLHCGKMQWITARDVNSALIEEHKRTNPALLHMLPQLSMNENLVPSYGRAASLCSVISSTLFLHFFLFLPFPIILIDICLVYFYPLTSLLSYLLSVLLSSHFFCCVCSSFRLHSAWVCSSRPIYLAKAVNDLCWALTAWPCLTALPVINYFSGRLII